MKPRPALGRLRPLTLRTGRRRPMRVAPRLALVWRARRQLEPAGVALFRTSSTMVVQTFPLSLTMAWPAPAARAGKAWHERSTLHRERLLLVQPAVPPARSLELLVRQVAGSSDEATRRRLVEVLRLRAPAARRAAASAGSPKPMLHRPASATAPASALHPLETRNREARQSAAPVAHAPRRPLRLHVFGAGSSRPAGRPRTPEVGREIPAIFAPSIPGRLHRPARREPPALPGQTPKARWTAGRGLRLTWTAGRRPLEPKAPRAAVDLVWMGPSEAGRPESRAAAAAATAPPAAVPGMAQLGSSFSGTRAPPATPPAPPAVPDMNRLVDEVVRRLERLSRDERMRRGI